MLLATLSRKRRLEGAPLRAVATNEVHKGVQVKLLFGSINCRLKSQLFCSLSFFCAKKASSGGAVAFSISRLGLKWRSAAATQTQRVAPENLN